MRPASMAVAQPPEVGPTPDASGFRADIEGLRGLAVLLVVLFHVEVPGFSGGFVGVDVFFVISGYLIIRHLADEASSSGSVHLARFWARRVRRLVAPLTVVVLATLAASLYVYSPLAWPGIARQAATSSAYVSNVYFAQRADVYFGSGDLPFLHTWSLSVEEQFYLGWPLVVLVVAVVARRRDPGASTRLLLPTMVMLGLGSFAASVLLTARGTPWAFYSSPTRAWEFAAGGLAALVVVPGRRSARVPAAVGWVGMGAVLWAAVTFDGATRFPGWAALVPVVGSVALLLPAGAGSAGVALSVRPMRWFGRMSYSWYLWHWPAIVLATAWPGTDTLPRRSLAAAVALALGVASFRWIEVPSRTGRALQGTGRALVAGAAMTVVALAAAGGLAVVADGRADDPDLARLAEARGLRTADGIAGCTDVEVADGSTQCVLGDPNGTRTVVLVGDSHAAQWSAALDAAARAAGQRLIVRTRGGCPPQAVDVASSLDGTRSVACRDFRAQTAETIAAVRPDTVVLAAARFDDRVLDPAGGGTLSRDEAQELESRELAALVAELDGDGARVVLLGDTPRFDHDPIECLARFGDADRCGASADEAAADASAADRARAVALAAEAAPAQQFDLLGSLCDELSCPAERDGLVLYADDDHLSEAFTMTKVPALRAVLAER